MRKYVQLWLLILSLLFINCSFAVSKVVVIPIHGAIGPAMAEFVQTELDHAIEQKSYLVIFKIDTPGGLSQSMRDIIKNMLASPIPVLSFVAPPGARAASAGTYIMYASPIAAMAPGTNLGAATPVNLASKEENGKKTSALQKKQLEDSTAYIRSLAQLYGRNSAWAEQAVINAASISAKEALQKNVINFIADDVSDLLHKVDGYQIHFNGHYKILHTHGLAIKEVQPNWRNRLLMTLSNPMLAYFLLMAGIYGLFFECLHPGAIFPGVGGAICLLLGLYAMQIFPIDYSSIGLIILGLALILSEAFIPSFGILGIGGIISLALGSIFLMQNYPTLFSIALPFVLCMCLFTAIFVFTVVHMFKMARAAPVVTGRQLVLNMQGKVVNRKGLGLSVFVASEYWQINNQQDVKVGDMVKVIAVDGVYVKVKKIS